MGCDIHGHFEIKIKKKWHHYNTPDIDRNYDLFAKLADVRNSGEIEPISLPKGLPKDISEITNLEVQDWDSDGHSHSWLNKDEIKKVMEFHFKENKKYSLNNHNSQVHNQWGYLFGNYWNDFEPGTDIQDIRFIFWFDN